MSNLSEKIAALKQAASELKESESLDEGRLIRAGGFTHKHEIQDGKHVITVTDSKGKVIHVSEHDDEADANDALSNQVKNSKKYRMEESTESEQLDELTKKTLGSYIQKASASLGDRAIEYGTKKAAQDEVDRFTNRLGVKNGSGDYKSRDAISKAIGASTPEVEAAREKVITRHRGIAKAAGKLTKESMNESKDKQHITIDGLQHGSEPHEYDDHKAYIEKKFPGVKLTFDRSHLDDEYSLSGPKHQVHRAVYHHYNGDKAEAHELHPELKENMNESKDGLGFAHQEISATGNKSLIAGAKRAEDHYNKAQDFLDGGDNAKYHKHMYHAHDVANDVHNMLDNRDKSVQSYNASVKHANAYHKLTGKKLQESMKQEKIDLGNLFEGQEISEEFKEKIVTVFESAVAARVAQETELMENELAARALTESEELKEGLVEKVDGYLDFMVEQWIKNNQVALERGIKAEIFESFVSKMHDVFVEHNINLPDEEFDLVESSLEKTAELESRLDEAVAENVKLNQIIKGHAKDLMIEGFAKGMTDIDAEKFALLAEEIAFEDAESFAKKLEVISENYVTKEVKEEKLLEENVTLDASTTIVESQEKHEKVDPAMAAYLTMLNK